MELLNIHTNTKSRILKIKKHLPVKIWSLTIWLLVMPLSCKKNDDGIKPGNSPEIKNFSEILGRPSDSSITLSMLFDQDADAYLEYGTEPGVYNMSTINFMASKDNPVVIDYKNLSPDTKYYYRTRYRSAGNSSSYLATPERTFQTQRLPGNTFTFAVEADPHLDLNSDTSAYALTLKNILSVNPDFLIDLGDTFMAEKLPVADQPEITKRYLLFREYFGLVCHSVPLFLVNGNHEGELGWRLDGTSKSLPVMAANTRKKYYPNPFPDSFYSGNMKSESFVGLRENYYSWEWGNALFIVLDPYWYTMAKSGWGWTLGKEQYSWFKNTLTSSSAKYRFIFCHNLVGGNGNDSRGGAEFAHLFEMGGSNLDGTWGFDINRPDWEKPIHTLMKDNHVTIFFHGHDHFYGKQEKDGIIYQEVPQPSNRSLTNISAAQYGYVDGVLLPGRGYLLVTVSDQNVKVEYIGTYLPGEENAIHRNAVQITSYTIN